jgi:hypothetical protein
VGRGIAALAADPNVMKKSGGVFSSWKLAEEYGLVDIDGARPDWGAHASSADFGKEQRASNLRFVRPHVGRLS